MLLAVLCGNALTQKEVIDWIGEVLAEMNGNTDEETVWFDTPRQELGNKSPRTLMEEIGKPAVDLVANILERSRKVRQ